MSSTLGAKPVAMRDAVVERLRRALVEGRFSPGEPMVESVLAVEMGVGRAPMREALLQLTRDGLAVHSQNRGFAALDYTPEDQHSTNQVRYVLETLALQLARERVSRADMAALRRLLDRMVAVYSSRHSRVAGEVEFHGYLWRCSGNPALAASLDRVVAPFFVYAAAFGRARPDLTLELFTAQHVSIIDYLRGESDQTAEQVMQFHLGYAPPAPDLAPEPVRSVGPQNETE
jgi:DNA-binding GntR family transcriptional regulator